ncbi:hypothetical protein ElyMa_003471900 [Elysia marginata]|uniref:Uncharacterized protein n=1 Tax=Elysia marginata TaxID=1093978 RepID=A0AAV4ECE1_9GAST|nr:hypothetical protein ElyMa_003471900 [Elysia marginata]
MQISGKTNNHTTWNDNQRTLTSLPHMKLKTANDLQTMRLLAEEWNKWRTFTRRITEFAEATESDEPEASSG